MKKKTPAAKKTHTPKPTRAAAKKARPSRRPSATTPPAATKPNLAKRTALDFLREWRGQQKNRTAERTALVAFDPLVAMFVARDYLRAATDMVSEMYLRGAFVRHPVNTSGDHKQTRNPVTEGLSREIMELMQQIDRYARAGYPEFMETAWLIGQLFAETIHDVALDKAKACKLEPVARRSLFMPSLRTRQKTFAYDFKEMAANLHLSEDCLSNTSGDASHRLDTPITKLVAEIVESIGSIQVQLRTARGVYQRIRAAYADPQSLVGLPKSVVAYIASADVGTEEQYLERHSFHPETLNYDSLPPLTKATAEEWWDRAVSREVSRRLNDHGPESMHLRKLVHYLKPYEQLADLRRRSKVALRTLARPTRQAPPPS